MATYEIPELQMEDLPKWAQHPKILARCREDLAYRCDVFSARSEQGQDQVVTNLNYDGYTMQDWQSL